ncbi:mucin-17 isoform X1 [Bombus pyrosoma]|uniref:mucin-17 isoform X1 n=1 Tax=Bombus pyrosoma TaxID=396416 RepID=UPI001CB8B60E|nr:mucin-17 isoform X1 [Bombus pyrosoma]XP_043597900.1 mucin-17 isoform X1 [Bombus pyrosoma]XP_043597903.1 mucin-17 isoform X1 [Bombus pyrosoma]XP_043597904.1 mucin-17 isoform X1 [Bombus pyrosoma]
MTGRRRVPLVLRVCTGVFLLLFSTVAVDATKDPPSSSEKLLTPDVSETSIFEQNKTILNKIPSRDESEFLLAETKNEAVGSYNSTKRGFETVDDKLVKDAKTVDKEKVPMSIDEDTELQGIRSRDQVDRLSTVDSANSGSKLEEIVYGTSGKSSSTKTISEDAYRLSRTNDLTTVTAKPALEESKVDETKNKTELVERSNDTSRQEPRETKKSSEDGLELKEERVTDTKEEAASSSKEASTDSGLKSETFNPENESAPEKVRFLGEFQQRKKKAEGPVKNSEVPDLKEADERKEEDVSVSLINDTYVNYSHRSKISTEKSVETDSADKWTSLENATNFITEEIPVTHESRHPKEEVEVVGNVTQPVIQRFIDRQSQNSTSKDAGLANELNRTSNRDKDFLRDSANANETSHEKQQEIEEKNQEKLARLTTERTSEESSTVQGISSPVPRGRTIAFESASSKRTIVAKKNATDRFVEQKPYPYTKSPKESLRNASNQPDVTTEEASALENTIGKGQSEEKFVVTEGSDVLENSIQQFKPNYYEKVSNESSTISSTEVRPSVQITTAPLVRLEETKPTNRTVVEKSSEQKGIDESGEKSTSAGNDVSRWAESRETSGMGNVDVTGNGITEVSVKPENGDKRTYEASLQEITVRTTPTPLTTEPVEPQTDLGMLSNADVQTNVAGSLLIRSTLNATELSTEYPLIKGNFSDERLPIYPTSPTDTSTVKVATDSATVLPTTTIEETSVGNVTEPPTVSDANGTNEIPSGVSGTLSPEETFVPTTTSVEFEFVGLSDSTTFLWRNATEEPSKGRDLPNETSVVPTVKDLLAKNTPNEGTTTVSNESTTENISSISETEIPATSNPMTDRTIVPTSIPSQTIQSKDEFTTRPSFVDEETDSSSSTSLDEVEKTIDVTDSWSSTSEENVATTTIRTEQTISKDSKDSYFMANVTESPVEFTSIPNVYTTDATRVATSSPFVPIGLEPRTPVSSSTSPATVSDIPSVTAHDTTVLPDQEEITSLVRIDVEGTWFDVCPQVDKLRHTLANILTSGMEKPVSDKQIIFHQNPCQEPPNTTPSSSDMPMMTILIYVVDEAGKFDSTMTKMLPSLYEDSRDHIKFPITIHRFLLVQEKGPDSGNAIAVVVVSSVALICLVLLTGLLFIMRKRQTRFNYGERCRPVSLDAYSLDSVSAYNSVRRKGVTRSSKRSYGNPTFEDSSAIPSHPLNFAALSSFCNDVNAINEEFSGIPQVSAKIDELPAGAEVKNRYANVIPLPETRVLLQKINNDPLTEYINASYVRGPKNATKYYVACQAPMESTVTDFWRMIWEQQCKVIIMLTDLVENGVEKCTEYIPPSEVTDCRRLYGDFQVTLKKRETKEKYAISTLHLNNLEKNTFREVYHIWYLWPVNGVQSDGAGLIAVLLEARALQRGGPGPIVVHCSPGTGRTGTLIALDLGIRQYEITRTVDVPRVVYTIRRDRAGAVKTKEQYAFIYKALNLYATKLAGGVLEST